MKVRKIHSQLEILIAEVSKKQSFKIICSYRSKKDQDKAFKEGRSRAVFGKSPHNYIPALAIDIIPEPFKGWNDFSGFNKILNEFQEVANQKKININLGRDFKKLKDYPHIELRDWKRLRYEKDESEK